MYDFLQGVKNKTPLVELLIFSVSKLHIPEQDLLNMELSHLLWVLDCHYQTEERQDARFANLMCLLVNLHRGKRAPAKPQDYMPKKPKTLKEIEEGILQAFGIKNPQ